MVRDAEEVAPASVAGEQERARGGPAAGQRRGEQERAEVLVGRGRVADVELHRLSDLESVADRDRAGAPIGADHAAHEEVAAGEGGAVLVDDDPEVEPALQQGAVLFARVGRELAQPVERGPARELLDEAAVGAGHHERPADGAAAL